MSSDLRFYWWSKCSTCRDARLALREYNISFSERDFFRDPLTKAELEELCRHASADSLFSWNSPSARPYKARRGAMTDKELIDLMLGEPRLIRRPLLVSGDEIVIGLRREQYRGLAGAE